MIGYGTAELGITAVEFFIQVNLLKLYTGTIGLAPQTAGVVMAVAVVWDAVSDPLMGSISDRTRSRWGKRRPYILGGSLLLAATFVVLFSPPPLASEVMQGVFLLISYLLVNTAMTVIAVPHAALGGELSSEPDARTEVFGWRFLFANLGLLVAIVVPAVLAASLPEPEPGAVPQLGSMAVAVLVLVTAGVTVTATRGRDATSSERPFAVREFFIGLRSVLRNRPFCPLLVAFVLGSIGRTINASIALFYYEHRLQLAEQDVFLYVLMPFTLVIALSIGGWLWASRWFGKKYPAVVGIGALGIGTCLAYPSFEPGSLVGPVIAGVVGGILVGAVFLLDSTVADIVDYDEVYSGVHREGLYFGFWRMATKLARAVGLALSGFLLSWIGFVEGAASQSADTARGLALVFGPGVGVFFMAAALVYLWMPLTRDRHAVVRRILARRQAR
jgi:GPH family glycoside/pentoside/hexuronide:cation symporter